MWGGGGGGGGGGSGSQASSLASQPYFSLFPVGPPEIRKNTAGSQDNWRHLIQHNTFQFEVLPLVL